MGFLRARRALPVSCHCLAQGTPSRPPKGGSPTRALEHRGHEQGRRGKDGYRHAGPLSPPRALRARLSPCVPAFRALCAPARTHPFIFISIKFPRTIPFPPPVPLTGDAQPVRALLARARLRLRVLAPACTASASTLTRAAFAGVPRLPVGRAHATRPHF